MSFQLDAPASTAPRTPSRTVDYRDDYRNGFVDALICQQGIVAPTPTEIREAIAILTCYRAHRRVDTDNQPVDDLRPALLAVMRLMRTQLERRPTA